MTARCLSRLTPMPAEGLSAAAQRALAEGRRRVPHRLDFARRDVITWRSKAAEHLSISGVQDKVSLRLVKGRLQPTEHDGEFLLKPVPSAELPAFHGEVPANEHATMQVASQVFGIETPPNTLVRFADGELAYMVRRFDRRGGRKLAQEDLCQLSGRTPSTHGSRFKYDGSYEELGALIRAHCPSWPVQLGRLFAQIAFCYAVSNGDAHLKNFSLHESPDGDPVLTPAYDLICTSIHLPDESPLALAVFADGYVTERFEQYGYTTGGDLLLLAARFGVAPTLARRVLGAFSANRAEVGALIGRSFLSPAARVDWLARYDERLRMLAIE